MDTKSNNAKATNTRTEQGKIDFSCHSQKQKTVEGDSESIEYQSKRADRKVGYDVGPDAVNRTTGGAIDLLREVGQEGLDYIDDHAERLKKRLADNEKRKARFLKKFAALEEELARIAEQVPQNSEGDRAKEE